MIRLHGSPLSNYSNMVSSMLLEKGIAFEFLATRPSQDAGYLARSPMGKIPCLETEAGFLTETHPILEFLEDLRPSPALLPADAFQRAKVRELVQAIELYLELVARRGYGVLFGREVAAEVKAEIARDLPKGIAAIARLAKFSPWIAGEDFTQADIFGYWCFGLANRSAVANAGIDLFEALPGSKDWFDRVAARPGIQQVLQAQAEARKPRS